MAETGNSGLPRFGLLGLTEVHCFDSTSGVPRWEPLAFEGKQPLKILTILLALTLKNEPILVPDLALLLGTSRQTIYNGICALNKILTPEGSPHAIAKTPEGYRIRMDSGQLDVNRFRALFSSASDAAATGDLEEALRLVDEALGQWHGDEPMASIDCTEITSPGVQNLKDERLQARELWCGLNLRLGRPDKARPVLRALAENDPLNEPVHKNLMVAEYRTGHASAALKVYRDFRERLADAEGIDPGPDMRDLYQRMLDGDEKLRRPDAPF